MNEFIQIAVLSISLALFALGGTGFKWMRRYVLPIAFGILGAFLASWWQGLGYAVTLCAFLCMGYGEKASWWYRALIFTGYGASSLWFGWSYWLIVTPVVCLGLFWLSNFKPTASSFGWKCVEAAYGFLIAASYISALSNRF
jgi:hypothetical protein